LKRWITGSLVAAGIVALAALAAGCSNNKKKPADGSSPSQPSSQSQYPAMNQASLDVPTTPAAPPAQYTPPPQPVVYDPPPSAAALEQPVIEDSFVDASGSYAPPPLPAPSRRAGTRYKVKKGESLWSIAQARYGNGNRWKTIAAANPTIDPNRIQAGQTIVLP
jgi:nucleoid-associated protein YgaU